MACRTYIILQPNRCIVVPTLINQRPIAVRVCVMIPICFDAVLGVVVETILHAIQVFKSGLLSLAFATRSDTS